MRSYIFDGTRNVCVAVLLISGLFFATPGVKAAESPDSVQVSKLLNEVQIEAGQLKKDAETLDSYARSKLSWQTHAQQLSKIKDHINSLGQTIQKLNDARASASPWQQEASDRILPLAKEVAANTESAIAHLNKNPNLLHDPKYKNYLRSNYEVASDLSAVIADYVDYGEKKSRFEEISGKLDLDQ